MPIEVRVYYLQPNITIEVIKIGLTNWYVYNYHGNHFRLFLSLNSFIAFRIYGFEPELQFENEKALDNYIELYLSMD